MTHSISNDEKQKLFDDLKDLIFSDIIQKEDSDEIYKIIHRACNRTLSAIDDPKPILREAIDQIHLMEEILSD